jgi:hypothetical protein
MNQSIHGGWDSANGPVSPRRDRLREWTRTLNLQSYPNYLCHTVDPDSLILIFLLRECTLLSSGRGTAFPEINLIFNTTRLKHRNPTTRWEGWGYSIVCGIEGYKRYRFKMLRPVQVLVKITSCFTVEQCTQHQLTRN